MCSHITNTYKIFTNTYKNFTETYNYFTFMLIFGLFALFSAKSYTHTITHKQQITQLCKGYQHKERRAINGEKNSDRHITKEAINHERGRRLHGF